MDVIQTDLAIVGAGPAGMAAAIEAAAAGTRVCLIDRSPRPGGKYFIAATVDSHTHRLETRKQQEFAKLSGALSQPGITMLLESEVWGIFPSASGPASYCLSLSRLGQLQLVQAPNVILAVGAYDRPLPFPGWTLPGVITAGAAQILVKNQGIVPGRQILLVGTGPLQIALAGALLEAGAQVAAILELAPRLTGWEHLVASGLGQWERLTEGWHYARSIAQHRVPLHFGQTVFRVEGGSRVETAIVGSVDASGSPIPGSERSLEVDAVCLGFGFVPSVEYARVLGCRLVFDEFLEAYVVERDSWMRTSVPGVYVAGDCASVNGKTAALLEGRLAAIAVCEHLGQIPSARAHQMAKGLALRWSREQRFSRTLSQVFRYRRGLEKLATDDTELCRCEEVTVGALRRAIADGAMTLNSLRSMTRVGMGRCQGRYCGLTAARLLAGQTSRCMDEVELFTPRVPILPVRASVLRQGMDLRVD